MTGADDNLDKLLEQVAAGRLDDLTPEQVAALEEHLNSAPEAQDRLADTLASIESSLPVDRTMPSEADWEGVWQNIEIAGPVAAPSPFVRRTFRIWRGVTAGGGMFGAAGSLASDIRAGRGGLGNATVGQRGSAGAGSL